MKTSRNMLPALAAAAMAAGLGLHAAPSTAASFVATQAVGEQSTSSLIGLKVENSAGENLGDINYLVIDDKGMISTVVVGVGGFLGVGEKNIGVPFSDVKMTSNKDGKKVALVTATKDSLTAAPAYVWTEKSTMETLKEDATALAEKAKKTAAGMTEKVKQPAAQPQ